MLAFARARSIAATFLFLTLVACGGGGGDTGGGGSGGGPSGSGGGVTFSLDKSAINFDFLQNAPLPSDTITATGRDPFSGTLYVGAIVEGTGIDPNITLLASGNQGTFTIRPSPALQQVLPTGRILLLACSDAACNNRIGGTPLAVRFRVVVRPALATIPNPINLAANSGSEAGQTVQVQFPAGVTTFTASLITNASNTFRIESITGTSLRVVGRSLPAGIYRHAADQCRHGLCAGADRLHRHQRRSAH